MTNTTPFDQIPPPKPGFPHRKNWLVVTIMIAFVFTLASIALRLLTPTQPKTTIPQTPSNHTNFDGSISKITALTYTGPNPTIEKTLPVLKASVSADIADQLAQKLIAKYQLNPHPHSKNIWEKDNYHLVRDTGAQSYVFTQILPEDDIVQTNTPRLVVNTTEAIKVAQTTAGELFPSETLTPLAGQIKYYAHKPQSYEYEEVTPNKATLAEIPFNPSSGSFLVFLPRQSDLAIKIYVSAEGKLQKIVFPLEWVRLSAGQPTDTITNKQALANLNQGFGSVVRAYQDTFKPFDITQIVGGNLTKVSLEYRVDTDLGIAYPAYRFGGQVTGGDGSTYQAELVTPAIATAPNPNGNK